MPITFRLLTFNTLFFGDVRARIHALGQILNGSHLDVVCLQEVAWRRNFSLLCKVAATYPNVAHAPYGPAVKGGLVTLSRWPIEHQHYVVYRVRAARGLPNLDWLLRKGMLITRIRIRDACVTIVNTHLLANSDGDWSPTNAYAKGEEAELRQMAEMLAGIDTDLSLVVAGDFNVPRGSWLFDQFLISTGLHDVMAGRIEPTFRPIPDIPNPTAIDHMLVRASPRHEVAADARLVFKEKVQLPHGRWDYLSDHYGIEARIEFRDASS